MTKQYNAINWNKIPNRVDYSAWSRLNDFIWEPERIPVNQDKQEFKQLDADTQEAVLHAFGVLALLSTIQVETGDDEVKKDAATPQEYSVFNALGYQESIANKAYSNVVQNLAEPSQVNNIFAWADKQPELQQLANKLIDIYENGKPWQKKIALSYVEMSLYHIGFYGPLYLFGQDKLVRCAEILKLAIRSTTFNAMYPGVKFRAELDQYSEEDQIKIKDWLENFVDEIDYISEQIIVAIYGKVGWAAEAIKYFHYTLNKNYMNLGYPTPYPDDAETINDTILRGVIKSADFDDFFYYSNRNTLTKLNIR